MIQHFWTEEVTTSATSREVIKLVPKAGKEYLLNNWHPLTMLPLIRKLTGRVILDRVRSKVPKLINAKQTGFVKGR